MGRDCRCSSTPHAGRRPSSRCAKQQARRLLDLCQAQAEKLDCVEELGYVENILEHGTGSTLQRDTFDKTDGDLRQVVTAILEATGKPWTHPETA